MTDLPKHTEHFSYADYADWPDDERWELIDGEAYAMSPAPPVRHQSLSHNLSFQLELHFKRGPCRVFTAPTDVTLSDSDMLQPDLLVACDPKQITPRFIDGPPSLVIAIQSLELREMPGSYRTP